LIALNLLLEQDGSESRVKSANTLSADNLAETGDEAGSELGVGDHADTGGLERAQSDISEELTSRGRGEVDGGTVLLGGLVTDEVDGLLLEELVSSKLEGTLEEVTSEGRAKTSQESASTLILDDLANTADETAVVGRRVKLDTGLDAVVESKSASELIEAFWTSTMSPAGCDILAMFPSLLLFHPS
jgi:hypothetical protein